MEVIKLDFMIGKTFDKVVQDSKYSIDFILKDQLEITGYRMEHLQDCCECVMVEDIAGDLEDLTNSPILTAEVRTSRDEELLDKKEFLDDSNTWTFFELATNKGSVTIRWWGSSNGYYGEDVDIYEINKTGSSGKTVHRGFDFYRS